MTLCIAWKKGNEISLISDSRLTTNNLVVSENANKIFSIYVNLYRGSYKSRKHIHSTKFGLCFAGSYLNGSVLADCISELTSELLFNKELPTFLEISNIAFLVFKKVTSAHMTIHRENAFAEVFFSGYDFQTMKSKIAKFSCHLEGNQLKFNHEILSMQENSFLYLGSKQAKSRATELFNLNGVTLTTPFQIMQEIISSSSFPEVGGAIQYGCLLKGKYFRIYGFMEPDNTPMGFKRLFRNIPISQEEISQICSSIQIGLLAMHPLKGAKPLQLKPNHNPDI